MNKPFIRLLVTPLLVSLSLVYAAVAVAAADKQYPLVFNDPEYNISFRVWQLEQKVCEVGHDDGELKCHLNLTKAVTMTGDFWSKEICERNIDWDRQELKIKGWLLQGEGECAPTVMSAEAVCVELYEDRHSGKCMEELNGSTLN